jgi:nicotinamidase-related amidase
MLRVMIGKGVLVVVTAGTQTTVPNWVSEWFEQIEPLSFAEIDTDPSKAAVFCTDMIVGFCMEGPLASERVGALMEPVRAFFERAFDAGIREFMLTQDTHDPNTPEFEVWPPHCMAGTPESQTVPALSSLPFADHFTIIRKNSLAPYQDTDFDRWLDDRPDLRTAIVTGDCTDLCVYQLAMHLRTRANARNIQGFEVIVPVDCVDTFDLPPNVAGPSGAFAHPGEFYHQVFLHHMALNGVRVVSSITAS